MDVMNSTADTSAGSTELSWPQTPSALMIMGKRQGTKKENKQLWGRIAMAAALWHSAPEPKPHIIFVASDVHGPQHRPDVAVVEKMLINQFEIPPDFLILRRHSNCTLLEVRAARVLSKTYNIFHLFALTHLYHAPRAQRYLTEVMSNASIIPVHPEILAEIVFPLTYMDLLPEIERLVADSQPGRWDSIREQFIEILLNLAHTVDPRGKLERRLARMLRPSAYS